MSERRTVYLDHDWDVDLFSYDEKPPQFGTGVRVEVDSDTFERWASVTDAYWALQEELEALHKAGPSSISDPVEALRLAPVKP